MLKIKVESARREGRNKFEKIDMAAYAKKMFGMFDGEEQNVEILCENGLAGVMIDRFGKDVPMLKVDEEHFKVVTKVAASSHFIHWGDGTGKWCKNCRTGESGERSKRGNTEIIRTIYEITEQRFETQVKIYGLVIMYDRVILGRQQRFLGWLYLFSGKERWKNL